jgi:LysR family transcriptional regulator of beta-lactamase
MDLPLNALRAFEVSARHLNFTRAAAELHLSATAVSQHVKNLKSRLGVSLFRRVSRGLALTDEGHALLPLLADSFARIAAMLDGFKEARPREVLSVGAVGTFAVGWLLPNLREFQRAHPFIDLRLFTNNNRVDLAGEGLDFAVRFGDGNWHSTDAIPLMEAKLAPVCAPAVAERLREPRDLGREALLRSYRADEWAAWFAAAELEPPIVRGVIFDSSLAMAEAAAQGAGVALLPSAMFNRDLRSGRLVKMFDLEIDAGSYWLTRLKSRRTSAAMRAFRDWIVASSSRR